MLRHVLGMKKTILIGLTVLFALGFVAILFIASMLGSIIKKGVETVGPQVAKVPVRLGGASVSFASGQAALTGLLVGNPEGYKTPSSIEVGKMSVALKPLSVLSDKVVVESVILESPHLTFEGGISGNNLSKILQNIRSFAGSSAEASEKEQGAAGKKLEVGLIKVTGAKVSVSVSGMKGAPIELALPDIELRDLGKGSDGISSTDLISRVMEKVVAIAVKAATENVGNLGKGLIDGAGDAGKEGSDTLKKTTKGISDLFKK